MEFLAESIYKLTADPDGADVTAVEVSSEVLVNVLFKS